MSNTTTAGPIGDVMADLKKLNEAIAAYNEAIAHIPMAAHHAEKLVGLRGEIAVAYSDAETKAVALRDSISSAVNAAVDETLAELDVLGLSEDDGLNVANMLVNQVMSWIDDPTTDFVSCAASCFDDPSEYGDLFPILAAK